MAGKIAKTKITSISLDGVSMERARALENHFGLSRQALIDELAERTATRQSVQDAFRRYAKKASATGQGKKDGSKGSVLGIKVSADLAKNLSVVEAQIVPSNGRSEALRLLFSFWFEKQKLTLTQNKNAEKPARQASRATVPVKKATATLQRTPRKK